MARSLRKPLRVRWTPDMDTRYFQQSWRGQKRFVRLFLLPLPPVVAVLLTWHFAKLPGYPPLWIWALGLGSFSFCLAMAFVFWRCPSCDELLFRTSKSGAGVLFWLADPDDCPHCGLPLRPPEEAGK